MWWESLLPEALHPWAETLFDVPIIHVRRALKQAEDRQHPQVEIRLLRNIENRLGSSAALHDVLLYVRSSKTAYRARSNVLAMLASEVAMAFYKDDQIDLEAIRVIDELAGASRESGDVWLARILNTAFRDFTGLATRTDNRVAAEVSS